MVAAEARLPFADETLSFIDANIVLQHLLYLLPDFSSGLIRIVILFAFIRDFGLCQAGKMERCRCTVRRSTLFAVLCSAFLGVQLANTAAESFNGHLEYLDHPLARGYVGKQYCSGKRALISDRYRMGPESNVRDSDS